MKNFVIAALLFMMMTISACGNNMPASPEAASYTKEEFNEPVVNEETSINTSDSVETVASSSEDAASEEIQIAEPVTQNGFPIMSKEEFMSYVTAVELTTENWRDYLEIGIRKEELKDAFGDVVSVNEWYAWQLKEGLSAQASKDLAFRIEDTKSNCKATMEAWFVRDFGTREIWHDSPSKRVYVADDFKCTKAKGIIYLINIPNDLWIDYTGEADSMYSDEWVKKNMSNLTANKILYVGDSKSFFVVSDYGFMTDGKQGVCISPDPFSNYVSIEDFGK